MTVFAIAVVRDEADIIGQTIERLAGEVDEIIVADNGSTDGTREILEAAGVHVVDDPIREFYQAAKVTRLAQMAREQGADWVVPFDADELWYAPPGTTIAKHLAAMPLEVEAVGAVFFNHVPTDRDDSTEPDPIRRMVYREIGNGSMMRVACRVRPDTVIEDGNHFVFQGDRMAFAWPGLVSRHYSLRSFEQFTAKARKCVEGLATAELHPAIAAHWREWAPIIDSPDAMQTRWAETVRSDPDCDFTLIRDPGVT